MRRRRGAVRGRGGCACRSAVVRAVVQADVRRRGPLAAAAASAATINLEVHRARAEVQNPFDVCSTPEEEEQMRKGARSIADLPRGSEKREAQRQLVFARLPVEWRPKIDKLIGSMTPGAHTCARCRVCGYEFTLVKDKLDKARKVVRQHTVLGGGIGCPGSRQSPAGVGPGS